MNYSNPSYPAYSTFKSTNYTNTELILFKQFFQEYFLDFLACCGNVFHIVVKFTNILLKSLSLFSSLYAHQDINFIYQTRISRAHKTINNDNNRNKRECNSRICRFMSESNAFFLNATNVLTHRHHSDFHNDNNNNNQETIPLLIETHDHHEHHTICKCSCLPRLFNCCFFVS